MYIVHVDLYIAPVNTEIYNLYSIEGFCIV